MPRAHWGDIMSRKAYALALGLVLASTGGAQAQLSLSGQIDLIEKRGYDEPFNRAFRGDDPFNELRVRIYGQHWVNDRVGVFTEFLYDLGAAVRVNGAYLVIMRVAGKEWLDARIGMSPSSIGNFGKRSTYFNQNPVIGVPLIRQYRTALDPGARASAEA